MLVTFRTKHYSDITMFGKVAVTLIRMMGHSGTVPGAILGEDVPDALDKLRAALAQNAEDARPERDDEDDDDFLDEPVSLGKRALPLIELLESAAAEDASVSWDC